MARILVVDDDIAGLELRKMILQRAGHVVTAAADVDMARSLFHETHPETVLLDLRLPEAADGLALIREFREAVPSVRIVVLSGFTPDLDGHPERAMTDQILNKPLRTEILLRALA